MSDLNELIERVRGLEAPSKDVDAFVGSAFGDTPKIKNHYKRGHYIGGRPVLLREEKIFPKYTGSLDVVHALIERELPGAFWRLGTCENGLVGGHAVVTAPSSPILSYHDLRGVFNSTPDDRKPVALALLLAFLAALRDRPND